MLTANCYERTVRLETPVWRGTPFTIDRRGRQWLVTAAHVAQDTDISALKIVTRDGPVRVGLERVPMVQPEVDVAVCLLADDVSPDLPLQATSAGAVISQDAYFLGFPYGLGRQAADVKYPFVKKATISAFESQPNGATLWYLDGINNPGCSGGPVVFFCRAGTNEWNVLAVVSGYLPEQVAVRDGAGSVGVNTGIILAYDIRHATESIDAYAIP